MSELPKVFPRPYDPGLALRLTDFMTDKFTIKELIIDKGPVISRPDSIANADITTESSAYSNTESNFAISGLFKFLKRIDKADRLALRGDGLLNRMDAVGVAGEIISNIPGEGEKNNPLRHSLGVSKLKGVHAREITEDSKIGRSPDDFTNLGDQLFRKPLKTSRPNEYRPVTRSEISAIRRLNNLEEKRIAARNRADWLRKFQGNAGKHGLTLSETLNSNRIEWQLARLDSKAARLANKFEETKKSGDRSGRVVRKSVDKIVNKLIRK